MSTDMSLDTVKTLFENHDKAVNRKLLRALIKVRDPKCRTSWFSDAGLRAIVAAKYGWANPMLDS